MVDGFPIGSRVRICGGNGWSLLSGRMATVVTEGELYTEWPRRDGMDINQIPCRLDEIGEGHLYWAPTAQNAEFVEGPGPLTRYCLNKSELLAYITMVERAIRPETSDSQAKSNAEYAIKRLRSMINSDTPRGMAKKDS